MNNEPTPKPGEEEDPGGEWKAICNQGHGFLNHDWVDFNTAYDTKTQHESDTGHSTDLVQNE